MLAKTGGGKVIFLLIIFILFFPSVESIGLGGMKLSPIMYVPGNSIVNHYYIIDTSMPVAITVGGSFGNYVNVTPAINNEFDFIINFPEKPIPSGTYSLSLNVAEVAAEGDNTINSLTSVSKQFIVEVYSMDKLIIASLSAPSVNENGTIHFAVDLQSITYSDIDSVGAKIIISNLNNVTLAEVNTNRISLPALGHETITASFNTTGLRPAEYFARAYIDYDGKQKRSDASFRIGNMDLILLNYTKYLEQGFSTFQVKVFNNWGNPLRNVYAKFTLNDDILRSLLQTPSINLEPWQEGILEGIVKVDIPAGEHKGIIQLVYEGEQKEEPIQFTVKEVIPVAVEKVKDDLELIKKNMIIQVMTVVMILLIILIIFLFKMTYNKYNQIKNE